jgi:hypothetical protein
MKRFLTGTVFTIFLATTSTAVLAGEVAVNSANASVNRDIKPFNLVHRAYSGHFSEQGVPGFNGLATAYQSGQIEAEDLVQTAIDQGRLSPDALDDAGYINAVDFQLQDLRDRDSNGLND